MNKNDTERQLMLWREECRKARVERDAAQARVKVLEEALNPFACVPSNGTSGGPLICSEPFYEDGSSGRDFGICPGFNKSTPHEAFKRAREALKENGQ